MKKESKNICVVGLGYIGLPTASILASSGHYVVGYDIEEKKINLLSEGSLPFKEPGLKTIFEGGVKSGRLKFSKEVPQSDVYIICVQTPLTPSKKPDMRFLKGAAERVAEKAKKGSLVVIESTVYPGATEREVIPLFEKRGFKAGKDVLFAHCPERVIPGKIIKELIENDRVIGGFTERCARRAGEIYSSFVEGRIYFTDLRSAEMVKLAENTFRMVNIALAMEFALLCEESGINVWEIIKLANYHPRVNILNPGPGMGGHCLPVDPYFMLREQKGEGIIWNSLKLNERMIDYCASKAKKMVKRGRKIAVLGVAYKKDVDDYRNSPGFSIGEILEEEEYKISYHDPYVEHKKVVKNLDEVIKTASLVIIATDHSIYRNIDPEILGKDMIEKNVLDLRGIINISRWEKAGFKVAVLGRGSKG